MNNRVVRVLYRRDGTVRTARGAAPSLGRVQRRAGSCLAAVEALECRRLLSVTGIPAMMGSTGINPTTDVNSGAVLTDLNALNSTGTGIALLHLYPGDYCTSNLSQGMYDSGDDTAILDCYNQNITPAISFEYYTTGGYAALLSYPWTSIGQTFATRYEPGGTFDQAQKAKNPNFNMNFGVTLYKAINEPDDDNPAINAGNYATALGNLANGVHGVNASLQVVPGGFAYPNKSGQIPNQPLNAALQPLINAIAPMLNNGTLAGIDLHTYEDATYGPVPGGFDWGAYSNFVKVKADAVPAITANINFYCSEFDYHLSGNATENSAAKGMLTQIWDNLGVVGDTGTPVTQLALCYTLNLTPASDSVNGMATQLSPWVGDERAQTVSLVAQLTNGMSFISADPAKTGTYVLQDAAGDRKLWVWQDVSSWTNELGTSFKITNIPATATELQVYGWNGLRETIPLSGSGNYTVTGLPGSETYMFLATTLPTGWSDGDIGAPALSGSGSDSSGTFTLNGSGTGIGSASDQFNLASTNFTGNGDILAEVSSLTNFNTGAMAGVMLRDSTSASSYFADVVVTPGNGVSFAWRSAANPNGCLTTIGNFSAPEWVKLSRVGNNYTAYYSGNGTSWTQIGATQTIDFTSVANGTASLAGLAVTADNVAAYCAATFTNVSIANPTVATAAAAAANPVTGVSTTLSVLGADPSGASTLTYTWATTGTPPAAVTFTGNGTNAAQNTNANFAKAGNYTLQVTMTDTAGYSATATLAVTVAQTPSSIAITPAGPINLSEGATQQFTAAVYDQFGGFLSPQPTITWSLGASPLGTLSTSTPGLYTAPTSVTGTATADTVTASADGLADSVVVNLLPAWLAGTGQYAWNQSSETLTITGNVTIIADPNKFGAEPIIADNAGNLTVNTQVAAGGDGDATVHVAAISGNGTTTVTGTGLLVAGNFSQAALVNNGTVTLDGNSAIGQLTGAGNLTIGNGSSNNTVQLTAVTFPDSFNNTQASVNLSAGSSLDITDNTLLLNYGNGSSPLATVRANVASGTIFSSTAAAGNPGQYAVGYADATEIGGIPSGNVKLMYTLTGDALLTGTVNFNDYSVLQNNYNQTGRDWSQGDWNHDGTVNFGDYSLLQNNYNQSLKAMVTLSWPAPAAITYGTALSITQLDATASVPGSFAYIPALGAVPSAGTQTLSVTFTPTDSTDYNTVSDTVNLTVNKAATTTTVTSNASSPIHGVTITFTATITPASGSGETGAVQFQIDGGNVGTPLIMSGNTATYTTSTLSVGNHSVAAIYTGDGNFTGGTSPTFTQTIGTATVTYTLSIDDDGTGHYCAGHFAVYAADTLNNGGLASYDVHLAGSATITNYSPQGNYDDGTGCHTTDELGFTVLRAANNTTPETASQDTEGYADGGKVILIYGFGQTAGNIAGDKAPGSTGAAGATTQAVYGSPLKLLAGTFTAAAPSFTSQTSDTGNVFRTNSDYSTTAPTLAFNTVTLVTSNISPPMLLTVSPGSTPAANGVAAEPTYRRDDSVTPPHLLTTDANADGLDGDSYGWTEEVIVGYVL